MSDLTERICAALNWQRALGNEVVRTGLSTIVRDESNPDVWDANHVCAVRARTINEGSMVERRADEVLSHCSYRLIEVDPLTPREFEAFLAMHDYTELQPSIQLVLEGNAKHTGRNSNLRPVVNEEDWSSLATLVRQDHEEAGQSGGTVVPEHVSAGLVATYRKKWPACQYYLVRGQRGDCAFGAGILCDNGIGVVENIYTSPTSRRRGIASSVIAHAAMDLREKGAVAITIAAHPTGHAKRLYTRLGFRPTCLTRRYFKSLPRSA